VTSDLPEQLRLFGLGHSADMLNDLVALATKNRWGVQHTLDQVARIARGLAVIAPRRRPVLERMAWGLV